ncbi:aminoglycoside phosphotransferase family protein [Mycolicibacterium thermoresistibile]
MTELRALARDLCEQWELTVDDGADDGSAPLILPVRTAEGTAAVLKIGSADTGAEHEHLALRRWDGVGAVRLLRADPHRRALLLERVAPRNLHAVNDVEACRVVAGLYRRLHVRPLPRLRPLREVVQQHTAELAALDRSAPIPHRLVQQTLALSRDLGADSDRDARLLHGNLHYANVFAAEREPWLATAPQPLNGDPHYELAPMLWERWDELGDDVREGILRRFHTLVDLAGLDEDRARGWVTVRVVHHALQRPGGGAEAGRHRVTRCIAIAKAVQK